MGRYGFEVLDADTHVYEPIEVIAKYLPPRSTGAAKTTDGPFFSASLPARAAA